MLGWQIDGERVQNASLAVAFSMSAVAAAAAAATAARGSWKMVLVEIRRAWSLTESIPGKSYPMA